MLYILNKRVEANQIITELTTDGVTVSRVIIEAITTPLENGPEIPNPLNNQITLLEEKNAELNLQIIELWETLIVGGIV